MQKNEPPTVGGGCEGKPVVKFGDGTLMNIDPFCEAVPDVLTDDDRWLCLDCAVYHFGGWIDSAAERRVVDHRRDVGFDPDDEANAQAIAYING